MVSRMLYYISSLLLLLSIFSEASLAAPPEGYQFLSLTKAMKQSSEEQKPMFLYFGRYGCTTCRKMHKEVFSDAEIADLTYCIAGWMSMGRVAHVLGLDSNCSV